MLRACLCALAAAFCVPTLAQAQEAIPTAAAPASDAPLPPAPPPPLSAATHSPGAYAGPVYGPCGPLRRRADGSIAPNSEQAHGEVSAAVGTHGYREAGGVVCQPVGDHTAVTIGVDVGGYGGRGH